MMSQGSSLHHRMLIAALIVFVQDLSCGGGAQAWTYNYSITPNRSWKEASQWCQQHSAEMVTIQTQEETDFINNLLPLNSNYYWLGIHKEAGVWTCDGTKEKVKEHLQNWASREPDDYAGHDCVEIYIKRKKDTAKWNNEKCDKMKGTVCYSASCKQDSCSAHAACVETVGSHTCQCHPGFVGQRCEEAVACKALTESQQGSRNCFHPYGSNRFNSSCRFHCGLGFHLLGSPQLLCQSSGEWNHPVPLCQVKQCPVLNLTLVSGGSMNCSHPFAPDSYNSTCELRCDEGYDRHGDSQIRCDHSGQWTPGVPACTVKKCPPIFPPAAGNVTCVDAVEPFSFGSRCNVTCQEGYHLTGDSSLACLASGQWSKPTPACTVVQCDGLEAPPHASVQCQGPLGIHSYGSICAVQCEEGFDLIGTNNTECLSSGNWSHKLPVCRAKSCRGISSPPHGSLLCTDPNGPLSFGSRCTSTCDEGFILNGTASTECTSLGTWSADVPRCLAGRCPPLNSPPHGSLSCSDPHGEFSFGSLCTSACEEGFFLNGTAHTECTSRGTWSAAVSDCLDFSFGSRCTLTCEEGFVLNGTADTQCTSLGTWSKETPRCSAKRCPALNPPAHGSLLCSDPHGGFRFGSRCSSACEEGFVLSGTADTECTSAGVWSREMPHCLATPCLRLAKAPQHGTMNCSHRFSPFSYNSRCDFACKEGFWLRGTPNVTCNSLGHWSQELPSCRPVQCKGIPALSFPLSINCSHPLEDFSFGSQCVFICAAGFSLNGTKAVLCSSDGVWSDTLPKCVGDETGVTDQRVGSAVWVYAVITVCVLIGLVALGLLISTQFKKKGAPIMDDVKSWDETENPAFEF
ncbi:P-selectin [Echeneis naucrates]|uniref:P-selectin n=1 Tax=Echeneis naucrates TaxID=173247 RepID=UPI001114089B|nr:E-selectin-like [Echeneis naucrates]